MSKGKKGEETREKEQKDERNAKHNSAAACQTISHLGCNG